MTRSSFLLPCVLLPLAALACGSGMQGATTGAGSATGAGGAMGSGGATGTPATGTTGTTGSAGSTGATSASASSGAGGSATPCPPMPPTNASPCDPTGLDCEYGSDLRPACRPHFHCMTVDGMGTWVSMQPKCPAIPDGACPAQPTATGTCDTNGLLCPYATGAECDCSNCVGPCGPTASWECAPPPAANCPTTAPNSGQACSMAGLSCQYGTCGGATAMLRVCQMGVWTDQGVSCPD
jgi:hypothetical protein